MKFPCSNSLMFGLYYRALMASELPEYIECRLLASGTGCLDGFVARAHLQRIVEPYRVAGEAQVELRCHERDSGGYHIDGRISATLEARCQRCLEWMAWPVDTALQLVAYTHPPPTRDHDDVDWVELVDGVLALRELVEDEVLLSCPLAPSHALEECPAGEGFAAAEIKPDRKQPFAGLADLLKSRGQE